MFIFSPLGKQLMNEGEKVPEEAKPVDLPVQLAAQPAAQPEVLPEAQPVAQPEVQPAAAPIQEGCKICEERERKGEATKILFLGALGTLGYLVYKRIKEP